MKPTLMVLAAGMGSRYGGLKQMDGVGPSGETIIDYSIYDAIRAGFGKIVFIIRESFEEKFRAEYENKLSGKIETVFVQQELDRLPAGFAVPADREKPWGTAHAILVAREVVNEPFAVINADDFYGPKAFGLLCDYLSGYNTRSASEHCLIGYQLSNTLSDHGAVSRGVCAIDENEFLTTISERKGVERFEDYVRYTDGDSLGKLSGDEIVSMNMWGFHHDIFTTIDEVFVEFLKNHIDELKSECYIPDFIEQMTKTKTGVVRVIASSDSWFGVTYQEDRPVVVGKLANLVSSGVYPPKLF